MSAMNSVKRGNIQCANTQILDPTNKSIYYLNFQRYEGEISKIIRLDNDQKKTFKILHVTTKLEDFLPMIRMRHWRRMLKEYSKDKVELDNDEYIDSPIL